MSLATNVTDLATAIGSAVKQDRTLINGNVPDLSALTTMSKTNLVSAVNEVNASVGAAAGIDDSNTSSSSTWSSQKTSTEIATAKSDVEAELPTLTDLINDTSASASTVYSSSKTNTQISAATAALINDITPDSTHTYSSSKVDSQIAASKASILGGADGAFDTLGELQALLEGDESGIATITTALGKRVAVDSSQSFTTGEQDQGRANIAAASAADLGDLTGFDPAATFAAALT